MVKLNEKPTPDYFQVPPDPKEDFYFDSDRPHLKIVNQILNSTRKTLYVKDSAGVISKIPARPMVSDRGDVICVNTTYCSFTDKLNKTVHQRRYKITPARVAKGRAVFIRELGMYFSIDENFLVNMPVYRETDFEDHQTFAISKILEHLKQCPIRIILSDPTEELKNVYGVIDNRVYRIPIVNAPLLGGTCVIQFASKIDDEAEQIFEFDINELKSDFQQHGCINPSIGGYNLLIYPTLLDAEEYVNSVLREHDKRTIGVAAQEKEKLKRVYETKISQLESVIKDRDQEIQGLKRILELTDTQNKREFNADHQNRAMSHQLQLHQRVIEREVARAKKVELDVKSSELGVTTTALKTAATIAPLILSAAGLYIAYSGSASAVFAGFGVFSLFKALAVTAMAASNILSAGLSWIIHTFW